MIIIEVQMKKFENVAMTEKNKNWKNSINRKEVLYKSAYSNI